jgi:hypothetical protein
MRGAGARLGVLMQQARFGVGAGVGVDVGVCAGCSS